MRAIEYENIAAMICLRDARRALSDVVCFDVDIIARWRAARRVTYAHGAFTAFRQRHTDAAARRRIVTKRVIDVLRARCLYLYFSLRCQRSALALSRVSAHFDAATPRYATLVFVAAMMSCRYARYAAMRASCPPTLFFTCYATACRDA